MGEYKLCRITVILVQNALNQDPKYPWNPKNDSQNVCISLMGYQNTVVCSKTTPAKYGPIVVRYQFKINKFK